MISGWRAGRVVRAGLRWTLVAALALASGMAWSAPAASGSSAAPGGGAPAAARAVEAGPATEAPRPPQPGIYRMEDLTSVELARVNRERSVLLQPLGVIQTHGPHLPVGTDDIIVDALVQRIADRLRRDQPDCSVVILPTLPVGSGPFPNAGNIFIHPSTMDVGPTALRDFMASWMLLPARNAWLNFCVISWHRDPECLRQVSEVCDYYSETLGMRAVNVTSLVFGDSTIVAGFDAVARRHLGRTPEADLCFDLHGGAAETSMLLALDPGLVKPDYRDLDSQLATSYRGLVALAQRLGWPGYVGAPARATPEYGRELLEAVADAYEKTILSILAGESWQKRPRFESVLRREFPLREVVRRGEEFEAGNRQGFEGWLNRRKAPESLPQGPR